MEFKIRSKNFPAKGLIVNEQWPIEMRQDISSMVQAAKEHAVECGEWCTIFSGHSTIAIIKGRKTIEWLNKDVKTEYETQQKQYAEDEENGVIE